jgi:hypothetical protein
MKPALMKRPQVQGPLARPLSAARLVPVGARNRATLALVVALVVGLLFGASRVARAQAEAPNPEAKSSVAKGSGTIVIPEQDNGPLELVSKDGGYVGEFTIENSGPSALNVTRVAMRGDDNDVRLPPHFTVHFDQGGGTAAIIPPHASKKRGKWRWASTPRSRRSSASSWSTSCRS